METELDLSWMTSQEKWAWEQIRKGKAAEMAEFPAKDHKGDVKDRNKNPVTKPLVWGEDTETETDKLVTLTPIPDEDWPSWQVLSANFIQRILRDPAFVAARQGDQTFILHAWVKDPINLLSAKIDGDVAMDACRFDQTFNIIGADIGGIFSLESSHCKSGLDADRLKTAGSVFLCNGAKFEGQVRLVGANIGGGLDCNGSHFIAQGSGYALSADRLKTAGSVFLRNGAKFEGEVRLVGASIGSNLDCNGSHFIAQGSGYALSADGLKTTGHVFLSNEAKFEGEISLISAYIGGHTHLWGSRFNGLIDLAGANFRGEFWLDETSLKLKKPNWGEKTEINLRNTHIHALQSSIQAWKNDDDEFIPFYLDGLSFDRIKGGQDGDSLDSADIKDLRAWVEAGTQKPESPKRKFSHQAYEQLATALNRNGREEAACDIRIALENRKTKDMPSGIKKILLMFLGFINRHGYKPYCALKFIFWVWLVCALLGLAWARGFAVDGFTDWKTYVDPNNWKQVFGWFSYSLDQIVPFFDLNPLNDNFLQDELGTPTNEYGYASADSLSTWVQVVFMAERIVGLLILGMSLAGITAWAERRTARK